MDALVNRKVVLFPDLGALDGWLLKAQQKKKTRISVEVFDYLELNNTSRQRNESLDIADYFLQIKLAKTILQRMIKKSLFFNCSLNGSIWYRRMTITAGIRTIRKGVIIKNRSVLDNLV